MGHAAARRTTHRWRFPTSSFARSSDLTAKAAASVKAAAIMTAISPRIPTALRIGVGWSVQEIDATPRESTDMALDAILTEQEFILCGDRL